MVVIDHKMSPGSLVWPKRVKKCPSGAWLGGQKGLIRTASDSWDYCHELVKCRFYCLQGRNHRHIRCLAKNGSVPLSTTILVDKDDFCGQIAHRKHSDLGPEQVAGMTDEF